MLDLASKSLKYIENDAKNTTTNYDTALCNRLSGVRPKSVVSLVGIPPQNRMKPYLNDMAKQYGTSFRAHRQKGLQAVFP